MWFEKTLNDLHNADVNDDKFSLLCELNEVSKVSIKTPVGITEREDFKRIIMQGGSWGPIKCSLQVDIVGKKCLESGENLYIYKDCINVPPLAMVDDLVAIKGV